MLGSVGHGQPGIHILRRMSQVCEVIIASSSKKIHEEEPFQPEVGDSAKFWPANNYPCRSYSVKERSIF